MAKKWSIMNRRKFLKTGVQGIAGLSLAPGILAKRTITQPASPKSTKPNILLIITDQQHRETISAINSKYTSTPGLDRLFNRGTYFEQSYCTSPVCSPSRSSIFTSRMPSETGVYENGIAIREDLPNIGQWLSQYGDYDAVYAGKWHLPESATVNIPGSQVLTPGIGGRGMLGDTSVSMACEGYLRNFTGEKPFLMVASFIQPHDICQWIRVNKRLPHDFDFDMLKKQAPELPKNFHFDADEPEPVSTYRAKQHQIEEKWTQQHWQYYLWSYYRMVEQVDAEIENILLTLKEASLDENTLIIFTADHGEGLAEHQFTIKNVLYEAAARVPFIISLLGKIPEKQINAKHLVSGLDIFPTICDYAGLPTPPGILGRSLKPLLEKKEAQWRSFVVAESTNISDHLGRMIRSQDFKYIVYANDGKEQLFDLRNDPGEMKNLVRNSEFVAVLKEHREILKNWEGKLDRSTTLPMNKIWDIS
jgi:arylsulfatase A-like enzyme